MFRTLRRLPSTPLSYDHPGPAGASGCGQRPLAGVARWLRTRRHRTRQSAEPKARHPRSDTRGAVGGAFTLSASLHHGSQRPEPTATTLCDAATRSRHACLAYDCLTMLGPLGGAEGSSGDEPKHGTTRLAHDTGRLRGIADLIVGATGPATMGPGERRVSHHTTRWPTPIASRSACRVVGGTHTTTKGTPMGERFGRVI